MSKSTDFFIRSGLLVGMFVINPPPSDRLRIVSIVVYLLVDLLLRLFDRTPDISPEVRT